MSAFKLKVIKMEVKYITETDSGAKWYNVDGQEVGLAIDGTLMHGEGGNFDCVDAESIAKKNEIIEAIESFESTKA